MKIKGFDKNGNTGLFNTGKCNSGNGNSGCYNSGYYNIGDFNSGNYNIGDFNSGSLNSGNYNSGYRNSGDFNSGNFNSGDLNSGYRNSGVFCNRKRPDKVILFNKESNMTWDEWYSHPAYRASCDLLITKWIDWKDMTNKEKKENKSASINKGYVKVYEYKEAWANLWEKLTDEEKNSFKTLPNFDADVFEDITGIRI